MSLKIFNKYDNLWNKLEIKDLVVHKACTDKLKRIIWIIYLISKFEIIDKKNISD